MLMFSFADCTLPQTCAHFFSAFWIVSLSLNSSLTFNSTIPRPTLLVFIVSLCSQFGWDKMESMVKKYQQKFRRVKEEMGRWEELQTSFISQFSNASSIIQRLQVIQDARNYGALKCIDGIENVVLAKQMESLQNLLVSMNNTMEKFHSIVSSLQKVVRDSRQLLGGLSSKSNSKQLKLQVGVKPTLAQCLDGLEALEKMHQAEYHLKLTVVSALPTLALKPSASGDLGPLQQLLVDQPNIPCEEVQLIYDIIFAEEIS